MALTLEQQEAAIQSFSMTMIEKDTINPTDDLEGGDDGGSLNAVQQRDFFLRIRNQMVMNKNAMIVPMTGNGIEWSQLNISGRILEKDTNQSSSYRGIDTSEISLNGKRVKGSFRVTRSFFEQNVEGESVLETLVDAMSRKIANELEQILFLANSTNNPLIKESDKNNDRDNVGSTTGYVLDPLMGLFNGMIKRALTSGVVIDGANSTDIRKLIVQALNGLPTYYTDDANLPRLRIYMPSSLVRNLKYAVSTRVTGLGDMMLTTDGTLMISGIPVVAIPLLSTNPTYIESVVLGNTTTAKSLKFGWLEDTNVIVTTSGVGSTASTPYTITTDYIVDESVGTITAQGATTPTTTVLVQYPASPLFIITLPENILFGINENFRINTFEDFNLDVLNVYIRTRIDFTYREDGGVVLVKNVQNALPGTLPL